MFTNKLFSIACKGCIPSREINLTSGVATDRVRQCLSGFPHDFKPMLLGNLTKGRVHRCVTVFMRSDESHCHLDGFGFTPSDEEVDDEKIQGCIFLPTGIHILCTCSTNLCNKDVVQFHPYIVDSSKSKNASEAALAMCILKDVLPAYEYSTRLPEATILTSSESTTTTTTDESTSAPSTTRRSSTTPRTSSTASSSEAGKVSTTAATTTSSSVQPASDIPEEEDQTAISTTTERDANSPDALTASTNTTVTASPSSPHHCEAENNSIWSAWFISSLIVNGLVFVAVLSLVYVVIKKGSVRGKDEKPKTKQPAKLDKPTSIQIEKPVVRSETPMAQAVIQAKADQGKTVVDTTPMEDNADELDTTGSSTISDSTTGTFGNDQPRITVSGFSK